MVRDPATWLAIPLRSCAKLVLCTTSNLSIAEIAVIARHRRERKTSPLITLIELIHSEQQIFLPQIYAEKRR
jgi:hypothetical protein